MRRITYTSKPEEFDSSLKICHSMSLESIHNAIKEFEQCDDCELIVHYTLTNGWRVAVCNLDIVYGFHNCAFDSNEFFQAVHRGTPF